MPILPLLAIWAGTAYLWCSLLSSRAQHREDLELLGDELDRLREDYDHLRDRRSDDSNPGKEA